MKVDTEESTTIVSFNFSQHTWQPGLTELGVLPRLQVPAATNLGDLVNPPDQKTILTERRAGAGSRIPYLPLKFKGRMNPQGNMC